MLAIFGLLLLRFRLPIAAAIALATVFLPALTDHSSYPLTDSWGLALETAAIAFGLLVLDRGPRWLIPWTLVDPGALVHSRQHLDPDRRRGMANPHVEVRVAFSLLGSALAAAAPVALLFSCRCAT